MGQSKIRKKLLGDAYGKRPEMAWHYTLGRKVPLIVEDGWLRDDWTKSNPNKYPHAAHAIWFTVSEQVDPTSCAAITERKSYPCDPDRFKDKTGGHWRFGIPSSDPRLVAYREVLKSYSPESLFGQFLRSLSNEGENRNHWLISQEPVPVAGLVLQEMVMPGKWITRDMESRSYEDALNLPILISLSA